MENKKRSFGSGKNPSASKKAYPVKKQFDRPRREERDFCDREEEIVQELPTAPKPKGQCPHYRKCGGCQLQNLSYPQQLEWKQKFVDKLLSSYGKVQPIIGMEKPIH